MRPAVPLRQRLESLGRLPFRALGPLLFVVLNVPAIFAYALALMGHSFVLAAKPFDRVVSWTVAVTLAFLGADQRTAPFTLEMAKVTAAWVFAYAVIGEFSSSLSARGQTLALVLASACAQATSLVVLFLYLRRRRQMARPKGDTREAA